MMNHQGYKKLRKVLLKILCIGTSVVMLLTPQIKAHASEDLRIVTSFYPIYAMTQEIVGGVHDVRVINSANGIHGFEPSANDVAAIYDADIFIYHSDILESWTKGLEANRGSSKVQMLEATEGLELMRVEGLEEVEIIEGMTQESLMDPHSWLDPLEAAREAENIAHHLADLDPTNAQGYLQRANEFKNRAETLNDKYQAIFKKAKQKTFVTQHTAFSYLAYRYGLQQLGISGVSSDIEPTSRKVAEIQKFVTKYQVPVIFVEPNVSDKAARVIADATGADIVELSPLEGDPGNTRSYLDNLEQTLKILSQYLQ